MGVASSRPVGAGAGAPAPSFSFAVLPSREATAALADAESQDTYRQRCAADRLNAIARTGQVYAAAKASDDDRARMEAHLARLAPALPPAFAHLGTVEIVVTMPSADGGLPHTRPHRRICLPMSPSPVSLETLTHELWHIHQRTYRGQWERFLHDKWDLIPYRGPLPSKFHNMLRYNPDTLAEPLWIWRNEWVPVCLFTNPTTPTLKDTAVWFYNAQKGTYLTTLPVGMAAFFGTTLPAVAYEHPYEIAAYMLASDHPPRSDAYERLVGEFMKSPL